MPTGGTNGTPNSSSLRSRKFDFKKPLLVFKLKDLPLLEQNAVLNRTIPTFATGVEKEEEEEHHLQAALIASQSSALGNVVIPTPDASKVFGNYSSFYTPDYSLPKSLIRFSAQIEDSRGIPYDLDDQDQVFLEKWGEDADVMLKEELLEELLYTLEKLGNERGQQEPSLEDCTSVLEELDKDSLNNNILTQIIQYWKDRRYVQGGGRPIIPTLTFEELSDKPDSDPYVCFRRRELKPLRKMRRSDGQSLEKLSRLRNELLQAKEILNLVVARENCKKEALEVDIQIFEERVKIRKLKKKLGIQITENDWDIAPPVRPRKKAKREQLRESTKIRIPASRFQNASAFVNDMDTSAHGLFVLSLQDQVKARQLSEERDGWVDLTDTTSIPKPALPPFWCRHNDFASLPMDRKSSMYIRKRFGRGGRLMVDRYISRKYKYNQRNLDSSLAFESRDIFENFQKTLERNRFDNSHEEFDSHPELVPLEEGESLSNLKFRTITHAPKEEEYKFYINKPSHFEQISINPSTLGATPFGGSPPTSVIKAVIPASIKKRLPKGQNMNLGDKFIKKRNDSAERTATVKAMMQQAQKQAHQTQYQIQQMQKNGSLFSKSEELKPPNVQSSQGSSSHVISKTFVMDKE